MRSQISFNKNYNGKFFLDIFSDIQISNKQFHRTGAEFEADLNGLYLGVIKIEVVRHFHFRQINDVMAFLNCGRPAAFQGEILRRQSNGTIQYNDMLDQILFSYVERAIDNQEALLQNWWEEKKLAL